MKEFRVEESFWELFPKANIQVLVVIRIKNQFSSEEKVDFSSLFTIAKEEANRFLMEEPFSQNTVIQEWREAFSKFKTKKGARSSIEALLKRVNQGKEFSPINPLVDLYNLVSIKYAVPCGGEDIDAINGDLCLGKAEGGESFFPLGAEADAPALPEEIIYYDDVGAVCRCLNWREAQRTMLTEETTEAILVIEAINEQQAARADEAVKELKQLVDTYFDTDSTIHTLKKEAPICEIV